MPETAKAKVHGYKWNTLNISHLWDTIIFKMLFFLKTTLFFMANSLIRIHKVKLSISKKNYLHKQFLMTVTATVGPGLWPGNASFPLVAPTSPSSTLPSLPLHTCRIELSRHSYPFFLIHLCSTFTALNSHGDLWDHPGSPCVELCAPVRLKTSTLHEEIPVWYVLLRLAWK